MIKLLAKMASLFIASMLLLPIAAAAQNTITWKLDSEPSLAGREMEQSGTLGDDGQTAAVAIPVGTSATWIADEAALVDLQFSAASWQVSLNVPRGRFIRAQIGKYDGASASFTASGSIDQVLLDGTTNFAIGALSIPVSAGQWLAFRITNLGTPALVVNIHTEGPPRTSSISYPGDSPAYPVPELGAGILFGIGLLGLGAYLVLRRPKASAKV